MTNPTEDQLTWAQIMEQRHKEAYERQLQARAWSASVTEQLMNERSKFLADFDENEQRILGLMNK